MSDDPAVRAAARREAMARDALVRAANGIHRVLTTLTLVHTRECGAGCDELAQAAITACKPVVDVQIEDAVEAARPIIEAEAYRNAADRIDSHSAALSSGAAAEWLRARADVRTEPEPTVTEADDPVVIGGSTASYVAGPVRRRLKSCVEQWPGCWDGGYDPRCCRFPKVCSCQTYSREYVQEDDLESE